MTATKTPGAARRSGRRAETAQARHGPRHRTRGAPDRQDATLGARRSCSAPSSKPRSPPGTTSNARSPAARRRVPGRQDPGRVQRRRCRRSRKRPSTTSRRSNGSPPPRTSAWSARPAPARATCSSPSATPPSPTACGSATSPPPTSSRPSTAAWPTTRVAKIIDSLLRADLVIVDELGFAPLDLAGTQLLFRFVAAAYERRSLGIASHWPFDAWGRFLPEHTTAASMLDRLLHHAVVVVTEGESYRMREAKTKGGQPEPRAPERSERPHPPPSPPSSRRSHGTTEADSRAQPEVETFVGHQRGLHVGH